MRRVPTKARVRIEEEVKGWSPLALLGAAVVAWALELDDKTCVKGEKEEAVPRVDGRAGHQDVQ